MAEPGGQPAVSDQPGQQQEAWRLHHHALRQPLNALGLFCAALKMQPLTAGQQPLVVGIADAAVAIEQLVDEHFVALRGLPTAGPAPVAPAVAVGAVAPVSAAARAPWAHPACRIVVVDDDHAARTGLVMLLEAWGAAVQAFAGIDALQHWLRVSAGVPPDLLILDYHLPRPGDGLQALRLLRQAWPGRPVHALLITGDERAAVANALTDGSMDCLVKPVMPAPLLAAIRQRLGAQFGV